MTDDQDDKESKGVKPVNAEKVDVIEFLKSEQTRVEFAELAKAKEKLALATDAAEVRLALAAKSGDDPSAIAFEALAVVKRLLPLVPLPTDVKSIAETLLEHVEMLIDAIREP